MYLLNLLTLMTSIASLPFLQLHLPQIKRQKRNAFDFVNSDDNQHCHS